MIETLENSYLLMLNNDNLNLPPGSKNKNIFDLMYPPGVSP